MTTLKKWAWPKLGGGLAFTKGAKGGGLDGGKEMGDARGEP